MNLLKKVFQRFLVALMILGWPALWAQAQSNSPSPRQPKSWAVVIGIARYPKIPGGQQLMFADKDATAFAEAIKKVCGENVRTFINQEATVAAIKEAVGNWLARSTGEGDTVYIFFSGHGIVESEFGESYLLSYDSDANLPFASALSLRELSYAISNRVRARRVLLIADAVRRDFFEPDSGGVSTSTSFVRAFTQIADSRPGVSVMLANSAGEYSREGQRWNAHSVFTKYLLDAVTGGADLNGDGSISAEELYNFISPRVASDTSNKQHPFRSGNSIAEIILTRGEAGNVIARRDVPSSKAQPVQIAGVEGKEKQESKPVQAPATQPIRGESGKPEDAATRSNQAAANKARPATVENNAMKTGGESKTPPVVTSAVTPTPAQPNTDKKTEPAKTRQLIAEVTKPAAEPTTEPVSPKNTVNRAATEKVENRPQPKPALKSPPTLKTTQPVSPDTKPQMPNATLAANVSTPPVPVRTTPKPPDAVASPEPAPKTPPATDASSLPVNGTLVAPSPLPSQFEMAIVAGRILEPRGNNAWEFYQQMTTQSATAGDASRLRPRLVDALMRLGKEVVGGDVYGDNITDRVEDFKRAGQMFAKAKTLAPENTELAILEKLSAAEALISLQFYDEAERALSQMPRSAARENALGIVYTGKLDYWKAERAYKDATEMEPNWSAPHYNLALLYRAQKNDAALAEFERAAALNEKNPTLWLVLGDEYFSQNKWQQAATAYRKAVTLKPGDDNLHTKLGHALYSQGLRDEANREYQKAKELRGRQ